MLQRDRIDYYFSLTHELPEVEFKGSGMRGDNPLFGRVVRAAMAMTNRRGGGTIIIGVSEQVTGLTHEGLTIEQLSTWKLEDIASGFNSYTSSPIEFEHQNHEHDDKKFLILHIHEFTSVPVMCIKEYRDKSNLKMPERECPIILRPGAFYVRTLNKPESKEMLASEEVRMLVGLANDKAVQSFVTLTKLAGINIVPLPDDKELFARQLLEWTEPLLEEIRSRGYWDIRIRPVTFRPDRVPLSQLRQLLIRASINYRGWEIPYITPRMPDMGVDWIGLEYQRECELQAWRFFQSGQFAAVTGLPDDWGDKLTYSYQGVPKPGEILSNLHMVYHFTEIFGLASRLAITDVYRDEQSVVIDLTLYGAKNRKIYDRGGSNRFSNLSYPTTADTIPYTVTIAKEDVIARPRELAVEAVHYIFERFGYDPSLQLLTSIQSELSIHS